MSRQSIKKLASTARASLHTSSALATEEAKALVEADELLTAMEEAIRETIPVLERNGRAVLALKLRKLVS